MGATAVDFAYAVHTDVGNYLCWRPSKPQTLHHSVRQPLDTGQTVEVITSSGAHPNATWLNFIVTGKARLRHVRNYLQSHSINEEAMNLARPPIARFSV